MTIEDRERAPIIAAIQRRDLSYRRVGEMAGVDARTVQRFVEGETFDLRTLAKLKHALCIREGAAPDSDAQIRTNVHTAKARRVEEPIVGWRQAAHALGLSRNTLINYRRRYGDRTRWPWWETLEVLKGWFRKLLAKREVE